MRAVLIMVLALAAAAPAAVAQPRRPGPGLGSGSGGVARKERIKRRIRALRAYTLTDALNLDDVAAGKLFPLLAKYDDEFGKQLVLRIKLRGDLEAAITKGDDKAVDRVVDDLVANQKALRDLDERRFTELRKVLTPTQAGRLLVVLPALERKIQNMLARALTGKLGPGPGPGRRGGGGGDPDLDPADDE